VTMSDAAAPRDQPEERAYRCPHCGGFLLRSRDRQGVLRDVSCSRCRRRVTVFLGGQQAGAHPPPAPPLDSRADNR